MKGANNLPHHTVCAFHWPSGTWFEILAVMYFAYMKLVSCKKINKPHSCINKTSGFNEWEKSSREYIVYTLLFPDQFTIY